MIQISNSPRRHGDTEIKSNLFSVSPCLRGLFLFLIFGFAVRSFAQTTQPAILTNVGIDQKLGDTIPLDLTFRDENAQPIRLRDCVHNRPVILSLVYYECPMLCNMTLNGMARSFNSMSESAGSQFDIITVSFDPRETSKMASEKKINYLRGYRRPSAEAGWHFLTGDEDSIRALTSAVGFRYVWDEQSKMYAHASCIVVLTPEGKISKYFFGVEFEPAELSKAMSDARAGTTGTAAEQILFYCFHYDPATGRYGLIISRALQVGGVAILLALVGFISLNVLKDRHRELGRMS
jgi:protein SCO1/2